MPTFIRLLLASLAVLALPAQANWYLDNRSARLSFSFTRITGICEVHRFLNLQRKVDPKGVDSFAIGFSALVGAVLIFMAR